MHLGAKNCEVHASENSSRSPWTMHIMKKTILSFQNFFQTKIN